MKKNCFLALFLILLAFTGCKHGNISEDNKGSKEYDAPEGFVTVTGDGVNPIFVCKTEVTYSQWYEVYNWAVANGYEFACLGKEGYGIGKNHGDSPINKLQPVTCITWRDAVVWCNALSEKEGLTPVYEYNNQVLKLAETTSTTDCKPTNKANTHSCLRNEGKAENSTLNANANGYRLPTYEEWLFAANAGKDYKYSGGDDVDEVAWNPNNSDSKTHNVGTKKPNDFGIYDMSGNVWEWTGSFHTTYAKMTRICGGSAISNSISHLEVLYNNGELSHVEYGLDLGFRVVRKAEKIKQ